jgi:hypothetical protein
MKTEYADYVYIGLQLGRSLIIFIETGGKDREERLVINMARKFMNQIKEVLFNKLVKDH